MDERIRTRAYFKWLNRRDDSQATPEADWLAAEEEELFLSLVAAAKAAIPQPFVFTQDDLWFGSAKLADLFGLLGPRLRRKRARSHLIAMIEEYQDYLTSSHPVSDEEAVRVAGHAFRIGRLLCSVLSYPIQKALILSGFHVQGWFRLEVMLGGQSQGAWSGGNRESICLISY